MPLEQISANQPRALTARRWYRRVSEAPIVWPALETEPVLPIAREDTSHECAPLRRCELQVDAQVAERQPMTMQEK